MSSKIDELRQKIDLIDDRIKALFEQRMMLALDIGKIKSEENLPVQDPVRETEVISRLVANQDGEMAEHTKALFAAIFKISRSCQARKLGLQ